MKKYELQKNRTVTIKGKTLFGIKALISFCSVVEGDEGGFVESEDNLAHTGDAWVYDTSKVYDLALVAGNGSVSGNSQIFGNAWIIDDVQVCDEVEISGTVVIADYAIVSGIRYYKIVGNRR